MAKKTKTPTTRGRFILKSIDLFYKDTETFGKVNYSRSAKGAHVFTYKEHAQDVAKEVKRKTGLTFKIEELCETNTD